MICTHTFRFGRELAIGDLVSLVHDVDGGVAYGEVVALRPKGDGYPQWVEVDVEVGDGTAPESAHYARELHPW